MLVNNLLSITSILSTLEAKAKTDSIAAYLLEELQEDVIGFLSMLQGKGIEMNDYNLTLDTDSDSL